MKLLHFCFVFKVISKDCHPSGLPPQVGMAAYVSGGRGGSYTSARGGGYTTARPPTQQMITTHSSQWKEKRDKLDKPEVGR